MRELKECWSCNREFDCQIEVGETRECQCGKKTVYHEKVIINDLDENMAKKID